MTQRATSNSANRRGNVIRFRQDAEYFAERGMRYLEQNHLTKALKAFQRTVELKPDSPIHQCHLAGVLSELGDFEASNKVLRLILDQLDPTMSECEFYLANNYANMGEYEAAEECVLRYLDADPDGEYAPDAEEMLTILMDEFGGGAAYERWKAERQAEEMNEAKRDGRHLLEEGHFEAAVEWLERIITEEPENMAARNNLSLAYYYTGMQEEAIRMTESVLEKQPDNVHALCNLAVYSIHTGPKTRLYACIDRLRKLFPLHYDQAMKVGTTLGLVGDHRSALRIFTVLVKLVDDPEPILLHSLAAAAANSGQLLLAQKWWRRLSRVPDMEDIARYHLQRLAAVMADGGRVLRVSYQYDLPFKMQLVEMKKRLQNADLSTWRSDPVLRASLYWGLRHGCDSTRRAVIRTLAVIGDVDASKALSLFVKRSDIDGAIQAVALCALKICKESGEVEIGRNGQPIKVNLRDIPWSVLLAVDPTWQEIWQETESFLETRVSPRVIKLAEATWLGFLRQMFVRNDLRVIKPQVWIAALVYVSCRQSTDVGQKRLSQKDVAERFGVSVSAISRTAARLQKFVPVHYRCD